ncbi:carboxymuconolactone decarboxylase family protein [Streptomyces sp. NPDC055210]
MPTQPDIGPRLPLFELVPGGYAAMRALSDTVGEDAVKAGIAEETVHLVKIRVSQLNGCPFCIDMHTIDARADGVSEQRMHLLDGWRESAGIYTDAERAALALAEAVTVLRHGRVGDAVYAAALEQFTETQLGHLAFVATVMNAWNRLALTARLPAGTYQGRQTH